MEGNTKNFIIAIQNYEKFYKLLPGTATLRMVTGSSAGVLGWLKAGPIPVNPEFIQHLQERDNEIAFMKEVDEIINKQIEEEKSASEYSKAREKFAYHFEELYKLCKENSWGDPFSYARSREIHLANTLNQEVSKTLSGADAIDEDGECEYKTTIGSKISATYNGISVQDTWEEQLKYLNEKKICKYKNHYFARYDGAKICEVYKMDCQKVIEGLLPNLKKQYEKESKGKDPRLGYTLNHKYIVANSTKII